MYGTELALCQRYAINFNGGTNGTYGVGFMNGTTSANITVNFPVTMRTTPSLSNNSAINTFIVQWNTNTTPTAVTLQSVAYNACALAFTVSGVTAGYGCKLIDGTGSSFLTFNAEL
jgi:hypothetical protein